jgi:hypothetical protein
MGAMRLHGDFDSFTEEILKEMNKIYINNKKHGPKTSLKYLFSNKYLKTYSVVRLRYRYKPKTIRFIGLGFGFGIFTETEPKTEKKLGTSL